MSRKRTPKAKTIRILQEDLTYKIVYLYDVTIGTRNVVTKEAVGNCVVQVYSPDDASIEAIATNLYVNKGAFGAFISAVRA